MNLGADGSYFMRTVCGGGSWDLKSKAEGMAGINKFLEGAKNFEGVAVSLWPSLYLKDVMRNKWRYSDGC